MITHAFPLAALILLTVPHPVAQAASSAGALNENVVTLALQERVSIPNPKITVHFVGYRDDRCPSDVQCVWAGEAQAFFWISGAGPNHQLLALPWDGAAQPDRKAQRIGSYRFYLLSLEPRPLQARRVQPNEYKARLQIVQSMP